MTQGTIGHPASGSGPFRYSTIYRLGMGLPSRDTFEEQLSGGDCLQSVERCG